MSFLGGFWEEEWGVLRGPFTDWTIVILMRLLQPAEGSPSTSRQIRPSYQPGRVLLFNWI